MSRYPDYEAPSSATDWVINTVQRNPEGLLLLAAGCALLMRSGASPFARRFSETSYHDNTGDGRRSGAFGQLSLREGISKTADGAADYVSAVKDQVAETASSYASSVSDYAQESGRKISDQSARMTRQAESSLQTGMDRMLREQPLAVVLLGVAAGAAVASLFPTTDVESQALGATHEALADAASKAGDSIVEAAGAAGERLKSAAAEHGLNTEGLKEIARDVAGTFSDAVTGGKPDETGSPGASKSGIAGGSPSNSTPRIVPKNTPNGGRTGLGNSPSSLSGSQKMGAENDLPGGPRGNR
jgi:hypothetical protein